MQKRSLLFDGWFLCDYDCVAVITELKESTLSVNTGYGVYIFYFLFYLAYVRLLINTCSNLFLFYFGGSGQWRTHGIMESNHQFYPLVLVQFPAVGFSVQKTLSSLNHPNLFKTKLSGQLRVCCDLAGIFKFNPKLTASFVPKA
jgi:hypothetical protein